MASKHTPGPRKAEMCDARDVKALLESVIQSPSDVLTAWQVRFGLKTAVFSKFYKTRPRAEQMIRCLRGLGCEVELWRVGINAATGETEQLERLGWSEGKRFIAKAEGR